MFSHLVRSKHNSINKQEDTKNESSIINCSTKHNNFFNALKALGNQKATIPQQNKPILTPLYPNNQNSSRISNNLNTIGDNEISEYSKTNAHFSREEHEEYIMEKDIKIINNNVRKSYHKRAMTTANIPYKMNIQPMLAKIVELRDEEENEKYEKIEKIKFFDNFYNSRIETRKNLFIGSTACDSKRHKDDPVSIIEFNNNSFIVKDEKGHVSLNEVIGKGLEIGFDNIKLNDEPFDDLRDLDEAKEIDLLAYRFNEAKGVLGDKKLNISTIDLSDFKLNNNQKNSKILIVDSEILSNNSLLSINMAEQFLSKKKKKTQARLTCPNSESIYNFMNRKENKLYDYHNNFAADSLDTGYDKRFYNATERKAERTTKLTSTNKKMRRKYLKSELMNMKNHKSLDILKGNEHRNTLLKESQKLEININKINEVNLVSGKRKQLSASQNLSNGTFGIKKNLMDCFNCQEQHEPTPIWHNENDFSLDKKLVSILDTQEENQSLEYELKTIELITDHTAENINQTFVDNYKTPEDKIKKVYINALSHLKADNSIYVENVNEVNLSRFSNNSLANQSILNTVFDLEFINNLLSRESHYAIDPDYMSRHPKLRNDYRLILLDWIMELCEEFAFKRDTFHYTVNYLDRFLSRETNITKASLQLIGVSCLSIAAKFEVSIILILGNTNTKG
jgi:hypothetical protein